MVNNDLISRNALREAALKITGNSDFAFDNCYPFWQFSKCIKDAPALDAVPAKQGKWTEHYKSGQEVSKGYVSDCCDMWNERKSPYCPNCGTKMDVE